MNPWRSFRNLALWKQVIARVVASSVVLWHRCCAR